MKKLTEQALDRLAERILDKMFILLGHRIAGYQPTLLDVATRYSGNVLPVVEALNQKNPLLGHRITTRTALPQVSFSKMEKRSRGKMTEKQMRCRHPRCKARSRGPRFHYLCKKHYRG